MRQAAIAHTFRGRRQIAGRTHQRGHAADQPNAGREDGHPQARPSRARMKTVRRPSRIRPATAALTTRCWRRSPRTVAAATPAAAAATITAPTLWQEGVNYTRIVPAQPTAVPAGQVEVLEFFWYACPHCYAIDPLVESWKKTKPAYISFSRVHVMWSEGHRSLARLYYTLESLGKLDQLHGEVFKEIHVNGDPLVATDPNDAAETERMQAAFVKKFGISEEAFKKAYHSFAVETRRATGR